MKEILLLVLLYLVVGIVEKILFRVVFYRYLRKVAPKFIAVIIASLLFTLVHFVTPTSGGFNIFVIGIVFALYYEYKNNLMTITLLHFMQDAVSGGLSVYLAALTVVHFFS